MLSGRGLILLGFLAVLALLLHAAALFFLVICLVLIGVVARVWDRYSLTGVEYHRHFERDRIDFGDVVEFEVTIENRKILPLAWLEVEDEIPIALKPIRGRTRTTYRARRILLTNVVVLRPYERVRRRFTVPCLQRGEHILGPARLRSGDVFGFFQRYRDVEVTSRILVYPKILPVERLGLPSQQPLGSVRQRSWLFEDPTWLGGVREYTPRDGIRRIHWPSTARTQQLQVKVYEATTERRVAVFINLHTAGPAWWWLGCDEDAVEMLAITAASIANWACGQRWAVGLYLNAQNRDGQIETVLPPSTDSRQRERVLEMLARMPSFAGRPIEQLVEQEVRHLAFGTTVVLVTARLNDTIATAARLCRSRGLPTTVLTVAEAATGSLDGIHVHYVPGIDTWRDLDALVAEPATAARAEAR